MSRKLLGIMLLSLFVCSSAMAQVIGWHMDSTGKYHDVNPPIVWSPEPEVGIVWKTPMPAFSNASPTIVGDRIFVCAEPTTLICVRASDGEILWQRTNTYLDALPSEKREEVAKKLEEVQIEETTKEYRSAKRKLDKEKNKLRKLPEDTDPAEKTKIEQQIAELSEKFDKLSAKLEPVQEYVIPQTHGTNGYSSPTPVSDGKNVYVLFATGTAACYDMDGNRKWIRVVEKPTHGWGHSTSPQLVDGKVIIKIRNIYALDKKTGETVWKSDAKAGWGTGTITKIGDTDVIITANGYFFRACDGKLLAKDKGYLEYARPVVHDNVVYFIEHEGKAFKLPSEVGDTIELELLWETKPKKDRYYASSVYHNGLIYAIIRQGHFFSVIDAETGEVVYEERLKLGKGTTYPSMIMAGGYLYISNDNGTTVIMEPGRKPEEITRNSLEAFRSTPVFVGKRIYIRGMDHLYCIGE